MSTTRSPVKSSRPGSVSDAQHQTKASSSQRDPKEPSKAARRLPSLSSDKDDSKKSTTSGKPPSKQQHARIRTISESSDKLGSEDGETQKKSKAELKAERRALQEAQRASKAQKQADGQKGRPASDKGQQRVATNVLADDKKVQAKIAKKLAKQQVPQRMEASKQVELFAHLHQYLHDTSLTQSLSFGYGQGCLHPAIVKVGLQYASGIICGSNARCIAMLAAFKKVFQDYTTPPEKELCRDLEATIKPYISYLDQCRPLSVSMGNAIKYLKIKITSISPGTPEEEAKKTLCDALEKFLKEKIILAGQAIASTCCDIIKQNDVILVYAYSSVVLRSLIIAHKNIQFRVIVVDSRPKMEGRNFLNSLVQNGIECSYILINAVTYIMKEVSKVFLGSHALLANGYVMSRVGTSLIALVAKMYNVPVLVCCETYKFSDRVQTDSFVFNELGDPSDLVPSSKENFLSDWGSIESLNLLNLVYDVTSPNLIAMVVTEVGKIPCTSVPVVLRMSRDAAL
ncbi:translation initiation factor eIF2B subunit delta-like [Dysidea avara]|uniref:translation initiation factor eIF2B subunit delta-like n=1 Tax=Dysidea avara TaxID=196820 RepID=UPI0033188B14